MLNFSQLMLDLLQPIQPLLDPLAQSWGLPHFQPALLDNLDFCDQMLQALQDYPLPDPLRCNLYGSYIGPGPGGLMAFFWLVQRGHLDPPLVRDYLSCMQPGPAVPGALRESAFLPLLRWLLDYWRGNTAEQPLCQLLNSNAIQARARCAGLRLALGSEGVSPEWRTRLAHWACRSNHNDPELPLANPELHKAGFQECVRLGESPTQVVQEALSQVQGQLPASAGQATLDLLENYAREIPPTLAHSALLVMKDTTVSPLRRRAFQMLERTHGPEWIHLGLRDSDPAVRTWALQQRNLTA